MCRRPAGLRPCTSSARTSCAFTPSTGRACCYPRGCRCRSRCARLLLTPSPLAPSPPPPPPPPQRGSWPKALVMGILAPCLKGNACCHVPCSRCVRGGCSAHCCPFLTMLHGCSARAQVFGHGFLTKDGLKMGKSLGNTLDPKVGAKCGARLGLLHVAAMQCCSAARKGEGQGGVCTRGGSCCCYW